MMTTANETPINTLSDVDTVGQLPPPAETEYLHRIEATFDAAQQSLATVDSDAGRRTTLAVSVVIPVYNERETIAEIVRRVQAVGVHQEIIIVDDYSIDGTRDVLIVLDQQPDICVLMHGANRGKGAALRTAFEHVEGDVVIIQDADLEYDPADYPKLLAPVERGETDVVYGSRFLEHPRQDPSRVHRFGNWLLTALSNWQTGQQLTDMETCYKVFRRELLDSFEIVEKRFGFEPEITAKLSRMGHRIVEVPIRYDSRGYGEGKKIGLRDGMNALWCIVRYGFFRR